MNADLSDLLEREPQYTERAQPRSRVADPEDDYQAFSHGRVGRRPAMMIAFRRCSGEVDVLPYSHLTAIRSADTASGFIMTFSTVTVRIEGQHLTRLFRYACEHRVVEIIEADAAEQMSDHGEVVICSIEIKC